MKKEKYILGGVLLLSLMYLPGCSVSEIKSGIEDAMNGNKPAVNEAEDLKTALESNNPVFDSEEGITAKNPVAKSIDEFTQKALRKVFTDVKLMSGGNTDSTPFIMRYIVKRRINQADGETLYQELLKDEARAKGGSLPSNFTERNTVEMTVYKDIGGRSYDVTVVMDISEQIIWINVY